MANTLLILCCLISSFLLSGKKRRVAAIFQALLSVFLSVIVFCFLPQAILARQMQELLGERYYEIMVMSLKAPIPGLDFSVLYIVTLGTIFLSILSLVDLVERAQEWKRERTRRSESVRERNNERVTASEPKRIKRIYLEYCRLLN